MSMHNINNMTKNSAFVFFCIRLHYLHVHDTLKKTKFSFVQFTVQATSRLVRVPRIIIIIIQLSWYNEACTLTQGVPPWCIINGIVQCTCAVRYKRKTMRADDQKLGVAL